MRLIDADALKERAIRVSTVREHCYIKAVGTHEIDKAPTIEAAPVVHGQMEEVEIVPNYMWKYRCSCCHSDGERWYKYCPNCGAKMDLEV